MGAALGTGDKKSVDVELNIVPFIDLMSCLTAFLMVAAVWIPIAQLDLEPRGKTRDPSKVRDMEEPVVLSVLLQHDRIWLVQSRTGDQQSIPRAAAAAWGTFRASLAELKQSAAFVDHTHLELAAESLGGGGEVRYADIVQAMDIAKAVGFSDIGLTDRDGLTAKPAL